MGQPAYDRSAVRRRRAPQPQRKANLRVAKGGKRRLHPLQAADFLYTGAVNILGTVR